MSNPLAAAISGVVEGLTEFLPISSTGHLIVTSKLLDYKTDGAFEIIIQLGAILAVVWFYRLRLLEQLKQLSTSEQVRRFWIGVILAFIPAAAVGFLLGDYITATLFSPLVVGISLIVGGIVILVVESIPRKATTTNELGMSNKQAIIIGLSQLCALVPGVSRSASTIIGGMFAGLDRSASTSFSFYLSMPTLGAASIYSLIKDFSAIKAHGLTDIFIGLIVSFIVALVVIGWLLKYVSKNDFKGFAYYRIVAGIAIIAFFKFVQ